MKCIECQHWEPRNAPKGMAALGFAPCAVRSISKGHTFSMNTSCEQFKAAEAEVAKKRAAFINREQP